MKINDVRINAVFGINHLDVSTKTPIQLFCGPNGAGKSSIQNAIRLALTGKPSRVALKKQYGEMVNDKFKSGSVTVDYDDGLTSGIDLPKGSAITADGEYLDFVLEPKAFSMLKPDERRTLVFNLAGIKVDKDNVKERLERRNVPEKQINLILPMLKSGFPAANEFSTDKAKELKGQWKGITKVAWGSQKAIGWEPEGEDHGQQPTDELTNKLDQIEVEMSELNTSLGAAKQKQLDYDKQVKELARLEESIKGLPRKRERMIFANEQYHKAVDELRELENKVTEATKVYVCPCCEAKLTRNADDHLEAFEEHRTQDPELVNRLQRARQGIKTLENQKNDAEKHLLSAEAEELHYSRINVLEEPDPKEAMRISSDIDLLKDSRKETQQKLAELNKQNEKSAKRDDVIKSAESINNEITAWLDMAVAMAPDGIPGEIISEGLEPINKRLQKHAVSTGWPQVRLENDMTLTADGRWYYLLSESEQWRVDIQIAEIISYMSGTRLILADRFDVLDLPSRGTFIKWVEFLNSVGEMDSAFVFGTLKKVPNSNDVMTCHWIENGQAK